MFNNPFRGKPISKAEQSVQEWGKVKFKPTKFGNGSKHQHGKGNNSYNKNVRKGHFDKSNNSYRFNQVAKDAKPENATPWNKYKDEIHFKQREEEHAALQVSMDSEEAKKALKQREINYRKLLIEQKKQEPTKWENFDDESDTDNQKREEEKHHKSLKDTKNINKKSQKDRQKAISNSKEKSKVRQLIPENLVNNFDSTKLSFEQNDKIRKIITKTTTLAYGCSLKMTINDMKRKKLKKDKRA